MKIIILSLFASLMVPLHGTITMNTYIEELKDSANVKIPVNTLWLMVADTNDNNTFAGFGLEDYLVTADNPDLYFTASQNLAIGGSINGDTIFAMGKVGTAGLVSDTLVLTSGVNNVLSGREFAVYWFPGVTYSGTGNFTLAAHNQNIGSQVGGLQGSSEGNMIFGSDPGGYFAGDYDNAGNFRAVNLIPEPSAALLGALGALVLLRRRRN